VTTTCSILRPPETHSNSNRSSQTFLHFFTLRTGLLLILLTQLVNKVTAFYGILALLTAYPLSPLQLSMYIYSLALLALTLYLVPGVRKQDPWAALVFAQSYALDTAINAAYTAAFSSAWFGAVAAADAAGAHPASPLAANATTTTTAPGFVAAVLAPGALMSLAIVLALEGLRVYAALVALAYARAVLRRHVSGAGSGGGGGFAPYAGGSAELAEDPFAVGRAEGSGWRGAVGRALVGVGRRYWLGRDDEEDDQRWVRQLGGKFRKSGEQAGTGERERRRRSGTDPPKPALDVVS